MSQSNYPMYYMYGEFDFPHAERVYFDYISDEFRTQPIQNKLLDIGYMLYHNYDVRGMIHHTYSDVHVTVTEDNVRHTICILLGHLLKVDSIILNLKWSKLSTDGLVDVFFTNLNHYYHMDPNGQHYIKAPGEMTEDDIRSLNPWKEVVDKYVRNEFLLLQDGNLVIKDDEKIINSFNQDVGEEYQYHLEVPAYPWYGNPLKAKVVVLSLNPGFVERESVIARVIQNLPEKYTEGYTEHLRRMLLFNCGGFLPDNSGKKNMSYRDLANLHQGWYWEDRLTNAFVNEETELTFEDVNSKFAVIQYVGYSSKKYRAFKKSAILPSQKYTRQLIEFILKNKETIFIVPRSVEIWKQFLGNLWNDERFIESKDYLGQRFTKKILGDKAYEKVVKAFKS